MPSYCRRAATFVSGAAVAISVPAAAQTRNFDLLAQPASRAIPAFAKQAGIQLLARGDIIRGIRTNAVRGSYTVDEALEQLLRDTRLTVRRPAETNGIYIIERAADAGQLAANDATDDEVIVTGSNIRGAEITAPVTVITAKDIERSGFTTPDQLVRSLTQVGTSSASTGFGGLGSALNNATALDGGTLNLPNGAAPNSLSAGSGINLRGIGEGGTLILLNGRRLAAAGGSGGQSIDISTIPLNAIERIEILPNSASAIYGSDAVGGVVNVILKSDYRGFDLNLRYGLSATSADDASVAASGGLAWTGGNLMLSGNYRRDDPVLVRRLDSPIGDQRSRGGRDWRSDRCTLGEPGELPVFILPANAGRPRACLYGPAGSGTNLTAADFVTPAQAGTTRFTDYQAIELTPRVDNLAFSGTVSQDVIGSWKIDVTGLWSQRVSSSRVTPASGSIVVPANNPFNPFGRPARTYYDFRGEIARGTFPYTMQESRYTSFGGTVALEGALPVGNWRASLNLNYSKNTTNAYETGISVSAAQRAANDTSRATALNLFGDGSTQNPETLRGLISRRDYPRWIGLERQALASANGTLITLPMGEVRAAIGAEYRRPSVTRTILVGQTLTNDGLYSRKQHAVFGELQVPLIDRDMGVPAIRSLTLTLAGRQDWYDAIATVDAADAFTKRAGLRWEVLKGLTMRGQYSTAFRVPYNDQLFGPQSETQGRVGDPKFGGVTVRPQLLRGGNPDLQNQTSTSWSGGGQVQMFDRRLTMSVDYYKIDYRNMVFVPPVSDFILIEDLYPQFFRRNEAGALVYVNNTPINAAAMRTSGIDMQVLYRLPDTPWGSFNLNLQASEILVRKRRLLARAPETDLRRNALFGSPFSLRGTLDWSRGVVGGLVAVNHKSATTNPVFGATVLDVGSLTTVDAQLRVRMDDRIPSLRGMTLSIGATNLLDTPSPFLDSDYGIDFFKWDPRGRVVYLTIGKSF